MEIYLTRKKRESKKGDILISPNNLLLVSCLYNESLYPYQIMKKLKLKYDIYVPIQSIYTMLKKCLSLDMVDFAITADGKKKYFLNDKGKWFVKNKKKEIMYMISCVEKEIRQ